MMDLTVSLGQKALNGLAGASFRYPAYTTHISIPDTNTILPTNQRDDGTTND